MPIQSPKQQSLHIRKYATAHQLFWVDEERGDRLQRGRG